jgi:quercetin dioxygenase-like cupin family protein
MESALMEQVFRIGDTEPYEILPSGHKAWLLAKVGNLSATIMETEKETEIPSPCHKEEEFVYVLDGWLAYDGGREARSGEAVYNPPDISHPGKYLGKLLSIKVYPESNTSQPDKALTGDVINIKNIKTLTDSFNATTRRIWLLTENMSVCMNESRPGTEFVDPGHPEKEIIYVINGQIEYDNGRIVKDGEAIINLAVVPHPGKRNGTKVMRTLEIKTPCSSRLLEMIK